jgi:hypothetical protein
MSKNEQDEFLDKIFQASEQDKEFDRDFEMQSDTRLKTEIEEAEREPTLFEKKMKRMFGGANDVKRLFISGFMTGSMVGCTFGGVMGIFYAI